MEEIEIDRPELSDNKFIKMLMIISFSVYYLAKSLQVFLLAGTATHLGLALKFYLSILFSVSSFFFFFTLCTFISHISGESPKGQGRVYCGVIACMCVCLCVCAHVCVWEKFLEVLVSFCTGMKTDLETSKFVIKWNLLFFGQPNFSPPSAWQTILSLGCSWKGLTMIMLLKNKLFIGIFMLFHQTRKLLLIGSYPSTASFS